MLGGNDGRVDTFYPMVNADASHDHFTMVPEEQFKIVKEMRRQGQQLLAIHHSHPESPARPSEEDIRLAYTPGAAYVILSLREQEPVIRGFLIAEGEVSEVPVRVEE